MATGLGCTSAEPEPPETAQDEVRSGATAWSRVETRPAFAGPEAAARALFPRPDGLVVRTPTGVFRGDGATFEDLALGEMTEAIDGGSLRSVSRAVAVDPTTADVVYRGHGPSVEKSSDGGRTFAVILDGATLPPKLAPLPTASPADVAPAWVHQIAVSPASPSTLYAILHGGGWGTSVSPAVWLMRSTDGGATWTDVVEPADPTARTVWGGDSVVPHPTDPQSFYVVHPTPTSGRDTGQALYVTRDGGASYTRVTGPGAFPQIVVDANGEILVVDQQDLRADGAKVCVRDDTGTTRSCLSIPGDDGAPQFPQRNDARFAAVAASGSSAKIYLAVSPGYRVAEDGTVETGGAAIYESSDGARTWTETTPFGFPPVLSLAIDEASGVVYAATTDGLYRLQQ